jgi:hypothetical protein
MAFALLPPACGRRGMDSANALPGARHAQAMTGNEHGNGCKFHTICAPSPAWHALAEKQLRTQILQRRIVSITAASALALSHNNQSQT